MRTNAASIVKQKDTQAIMRKLSKTYQAGSGPYQNVVKMLDKATYIQVDALYAMLVLDAGGE